MSDNQILKEELERLKKENASLKNKLYQNDSFDFLFQSINQALILLAWDGEKMVLSTQKINKAAALLFGLPEYAQELPSPIDLGIFTSQEEFHQYNKGLKNNTKLSYIARLNGANNTTLPSELTLFKQEKNSKSYFLVFQKNLGSQRKVLEALKKSEYRFLQMAENIVEGIVIAEEEKSIFVNTSMVNITGYSKEELVKMSEDKLATDGEKNRIKDFMANVRNSSKGLHAIDFWIKTKHGVEKFIRANYTFALGEKGKRNSFIIVTDITSGKRIEQALRKSQKDFKMLADNSPDLITRYNKDLKYSYANKSAADIFGCSQSDIVGNNNLALDLESELVGFIEEMHLEVFRTGKSLKFEFRIKMDDGLHIFQSHLVPELAKNKTVVSVLNLARDITQIKDVERKLKAEKKQIIEENKILGSNLDDWCNKLCEEKPQSTRGEHCMRPIKRISEWIKFSNVDEDLLFKPLSVNQTLNEFYKQKIEELEFKNLEHELQLPSYDITIYTDKERLLNTLEYLFENALEATTQGKIELGYDIYNEDEVVFFIKDTGCGIEQDNIEKIFSPFESIGKENKTGLGLNIAQKNVESMRGEIWCLTAVGTGSTFCFTHPAQIEIALLENKEDTKKGKWAHKHIHIVEDTDANYVLLESIFTEFGPRLTRSIQGDQAIETVKNDASIDLVLMDIQLPGMNGLEATMEIRKFNKEMPIVAQTAYAMYSDVVKALDAGCSDFIAKPLKIKKLLSMVEKYLD